MEEMKILCVIDNLSSGGSQRQLVSLASGFCDRGHEVAVLTYHHIPFFDTELEQKGIAVHCEQEASYLRRILKIRRFIRSGRYDSVVSFLEGPNFISEVSGLPFRKWKLIVGERSANPNIRKSPRKRMYRFFHLFASYIVSNSEANLKLVRSVNPLLTWARCRTIYNIVDTDLWKPSPQYVPLKNGRLKLVVVASHQYLKNLGGLVEALSIMEKGDRDRLEIEWYGDRLTPPYYSDSYPRALEKIKERDLEGFITFYPATKEILPRIQDADAAGLFSLYEGLPNSLCEAMACGKPVICPAVSDMPLLLDYDPGLLFNPADPVSIRASLLYLLSFTVGNLVSTGARNREIAIARFNGEAQVDKYLQLMQE